MSDNSSCRTQQHALGLPRTDAIGCFGRWCAGWRGAGGPVSRATRSALIANEAGQVEVSGSLVSRAARSGAALALPGKCIADGSSGCFPIGSLCGCRQRSGATPKRGGLASATRMRLSGRGRCGGRYRLGSASGGRDHPRRPRVPAVIPPPMNYAALQMKVGARFPP